MNRKHYAGLLAAVVLAGLSARAAYGFRPTNHPVEASSLGTPSKSTSLEAVIDQPGPVTVETIVGADWAVPRASAINLNAPQAKEAGLSDGPEPIVVVLHALRHPTHGLFLIDTGVERALRDDPKRAAVGSGLVASLMHVDAMRVRTDTSGWLASQNERPKGVFLTHLHLDHISGMRDIPAGTPVYVGPGEATTRTAQNYLVAGITDAALEGKPALREWRFSPDPDGAFDGVLDVFGDQSVWALYVPGHTAGSTAFLARTKTGPVLMVGDACHTVWGWEHDVEPGTFSEDMKKSAESFARLRRFAAKHPGLDVRLGHQLFARDATEKR